MLTVLAPEVFHRERHGKTLPPEDVEELPQADIGRNLPVNFAQPMDEG